MIKTLLKAVVAAAVLVGSAAAAAPPAATPVVQSKDGYDRHVTIKNRTGWTMLRFYASDSRSDDWEEDILGDDTLPDGESVEITFDRGENASMWDLRIEDSDGNSIEWENIPLKKVSEVTLKYNKKTGEGTASFK